MNITNALVQARGDAELSSGGDLTLTGTTLSGNSLNATSDGRLTLPGFSSYILTEDIDLMSFGPTGITHAHVEANDVYITAVGPDSEVEIEESTISLAGALHASAVEKVKTDEVFIFAGGYNVAGARVEHRRSQITFDGDVVCDAGTSYRQDRRTTIDIAGTCIDVDRCTLCATNGQR